MTRIDALLTYLNDHLGGSVGAIEVVEKIAAREKNSALGGTCEQLHRDITADQSVVQQLIAGLGGSESTTKKAGAWVAEKLARLKLSTDIGSMGVTLVEELETLALGIHGKLGLWTALEHLAGATNDPRLAALDYPALQKRAQTQHDLVDRLRKEAVLAAFR
ncbi:MAG: hypothetical protein H0W67_08790 [Gemmatimonadales bacterium]|nr:hypothetical protein [Gemmatimonadales bacterium]